MSMKILNAARLLFLSVAVALTLSGEIIPYPAYADAQEQWQTEFNAICSKANEAMLLSADELKELINRSDKLKPVIEALDETRKKIYFKRLQRCKELYQFVLDEKSPRR